MIVVPKRFIGIFSLLLALTVTYSVKASPMSTQPKVIIFDVNETLLDLDNMRESVGSALG